MTYNNLLMIGGVLTENNSFWRIAKGNFLICVEWVEQEFINHTIFSYEYASRYFLLCLIPCK